MSKKEAVVRSPVLDTWRAIACLMVFFFHTGTNLSFGKWVIYGFCGVHLFFILSGYLIFKPFLNAIIEKKALPSIPQFYFRRFVRIYPAYLAALLVYIVARWSTGLHPPSLNNITHHLFLVFNYSDPSNFFSIGVVFWSLAIEVQFYLLMPWIARMRSALGMILLFILVGPISRWIEFNYFSSTVLGTDELVRFRSVFSFLDLFGYGMLIAWIEKTVPQFSSLKKTKLNWTISLIGFAGVLLANQWCDQVKPGHWLDVNDSFFIVGFPIILSLGIGLIFVALLNRPMSNFKFLPWVGQISYSLYLWHVAVQLVIFRLVHLSWIENPYLQNFTYGLISLVPTLILSAISFKLIEKPSLRLLAR
jgi:peptidoglycan/LPS O-acetylase OafA/YrhL